MATITQTCKINGKSFEITDKDQAFYAKMGVPLPTLCPEERQRRRLLWRNERNIYHRTCDSCKKPVISMIHPSSKLVSYCHSCWWGDKWDGLSYGRDFDFNQPFFEQFAELKAVVPQMGLCNDSSNVNSDYVNQTSYQKNCYLVFDADYCEDAYYTHLGKSSRDVMDCLRVFECELCYECVDCRGCYGLAFGQNCDSCSSSFFLKDCKSCRNCFGCVGLRSKEYCLFNEQLTKEEYEKRLQEMSLDSRTWLAEMGAKFEEWAKGIPRKLNQNVNVENCEGEYLKNSKDSYRSFDCSEIQDCKFCTNVSNGAKDCYDYDVWGFDAENIYECITVGDRVHNILFSSSCFHGADSIFYSEYCPHSSQLFGCVGLKRKKYCILNKEYTREEYEALVPRIIEHMKKTGEWGEFFPGNLSGFAYNETVAQEYFPLTKEEALARGYTWRDDDTTSVYQGPALSVPDRIGEVSDEITKAILLCEESGKPYKIVPQELAFYRKMKLPLPKFAPNVRHNKHMARRNPRKLWDRNCAKCNAAIQTSYAPERPEIVYCEACYLKEVY